MDAKVVGGVAVRGGDTGADGCGSEIDEGLHSRQLYFMERSAVAKMGEADVLISGMRWVGFSGGGI